MTKRLYPDFPVLLVDDEVQWLRSFTMALNGEGGITNVIQCQDSRQVLEIIAKEGVGLVLLDLTMQHLCGETLLTAISENYPSVLVIVITGHNRVEDAVGCMKLGALDYYVKTESIQRIITGITNAIRIIELQRENLDFGNKLLADHLETPESFAEIVTISKKMFAIFQYMESIARGRQPVLITGESGVGKELIAKSLHRVCRYEAPIVSVNVAGLDDEMFSDTLFGHKKGAFTGAEGSRGGLVEQAEESLLFLDEIGDLSPMSQVKLLRLLQDGEYYPVGSDQIKRTKTRFVLATNHDLVKKVQSGHFRRDLFYRLQTHHIHVPPLRDRKEDIPLLLKFFVQQASREFGRSDMEIPRLVPDMLAQYDFPGNIRELRSIVFDVVSRSKSVLSVQDFRTTVAARQQIEFSCAPQFGEACILETLRSVKQLPTYAEVEEILTDAALERAGGNQTLAARMLGISQPGLSKRLQARKGAR